MLQATTVIPRDPAVLPLPPPAGAGAAPSSCNTHAIVLLGPRRAFSNVARALAWAYQALMDSLMTLRMNSVPSVWGPEHSMWARCMEEVRKVAAHCSSTAGSHSWWRTDTARFPTF